MPDAQSFLDRCRRWLRALRGVAHSRHVLQEQGRAQQGMGEEIAALRRQIDDQSARAGADLAHVRDELAHLGTRDDAAAREREQQRAETAGLRERLESALESQQRMQAMLDDLERARRRLDAQSEIPPLPRSGDADPATWLYAAFEETFRGTRADVRQRLQGYVADVRAAHDATGGLVVDVGCGRGEWLELMRDASIPARGIDSNAMIVAQCRELALDVVHGDAIACLGAVPEGSLAAVTGFHVVEHLALAAQMQLVVAARRAIAPGGVLVLETPNPENLVVGAWTFYMDPSHLRPIPPSLLRFMLEASGFEVTDVRSLHPDSALADRAAREAWPEGLRELVCGPRDFAIVARRQDT